MSEPSRRLGFLQRVEEIGQGGEVDSTPMFRRGHRETEREVRLADPRWAEQDDVLFAV